MFSQQFNPKVQWVGEIEEPYHNCKALVAILIIIT